VPVLARVDLGVDLAPGRPGGLRLAHPLLVAAGGAGYGVELMAAAEAALPGAIVTRGTTATADAGAEPPRMTPLPTGLVSAIGVPNPGVARVLDQLAPRWATWPLPVVLALCAEDAAGFAALAAAASDRSGVAGLELHLGCRDLRVRRRSDGARPSDPAAVGRLVAAARAETDLPILAKLGRGVLGAVGAPGDPAAVAVAAVEAGADAICAIDGVPAWAVDRDARASALGSGYGMLTGPAIAPVAIDIVARVARAVRVPVVGIGGVATLDDVLGILMAGATAVGLATAVLGDPSLPGRLAVELEEWCRAEGVGSLSEVVGAASVRPGARGRR
jgi:dihydroorotate dehydrogenase (NAD+) catalytic subunit